MKDENGENMSQHKFGITSLINKRDLLQKDDAVVFKVDVTSRAVEVKLIDNLFSFKIILFLFPGDCCSSEEEGNCRFNQRPIWILGL